MLSPPFFPRVMAAGGRCYSSIVTPPSFPPTLFLPVTRPRVRTHLYECVSSSFPPFFKTAAVHHSRHHHRHQDDPQAPPALCVRSYSLLNDSATWSPFCPSLYKEYSVNWKRVFGWPAYLREARPPGCRVSKPAGGYDLASLAQLKTYEMYKINTTCVFIHQEYRYKSLYISKPVSILFLKVIPGQTEMI